MQGDEENRKVGEEGRACANESGEEARPVVYSVIMILLGVAGLVMKRHWHGPLEHYVWAYGGNVTASFAVFFIVSLTPHARRYGRLAIAGAALLVVESFEITNGFGVMTNTYDPFDLGANAVGVVLALVADTLGEAIRARCSGRG